MYLKSRLQVSEKLLTWQEYPRVVARKVDMFEIKLRRLGLYEHWQGKTGLQRYNTVRFER